MTTSSDLHVALRRHYGPKRPGVEEWALIPEARAGAGFRGNDGQCDLIAVNCWESRGYQIVGHELKVSRSDWQRELARPDKAERFLRYCHRWALVVPAPHSKIVRSGELPPTWGLIEVRDDGTTRTVSLGEMRRPEPVPHAWWVGWIAGIDRAAKRVEQRNIDRAVSERLAAREAEAEQRGQRAAQREARATVERLAALEREFGPDLLKIRDFDARELAALIDFVRAGARGPNTLYNNLRGAIAQLRSTAENLDPLVALLAPDAGEVLS